MKTVPRFGLALGVVLELLGCGAQTVPVPEVPRFEFEVQTVEQQALEAVAASPLEFIVPLKDADEAWGRAKLFFSEYTSGEPRSLDVGRRALEVSTKSDSVDPYRYSIRRTVTPRGYEFFVTCSPNGGASTPELAERNGRNVARFIREGTLEVSLLAQE